ncbi:MAG: hypothetical protein NPIRA04_03910 [Nitrospirales bacterium]|nr:MAG: hypothetical protein NPIRA04_03910 [Nitrospirales bacterium]
MMKDLLDKLSSYNIFNYLFPGVLFAAIGERLTSYSLIHNDVVIGAFVYYFYGLVISRIGSLLLEPFLKWVDIVQFVPYKDFVSASKIDNKLELFSEVNNMYRTLISVSVCILVLKPLESLAKIFGMPSEYSLMMAVSFLIVLFVFSYRKQTDFIKARITKANETKNFQEQKDVERTQ